MNTLFAFITISSVVFSAILETTNAIPQNNDVIYNKMLTSGDYMAMIQAMIQSNVLDNLDPNAKMTMFLLPNNIFLPLEASDSMARQMKANPNFMKNLLKRHIIMSQKIMPSDIQNEMLVPAMSGDVLRFNTFDKDGSGMTVNGMVLTPDTKASTPNIAIYKLTGMIKANMGKGLMDLMYMHRERFTILIKALDVAGLTDTLQKSPGPFTIFAPVNEAFNALPQGYMDTMMTSPTDLKNLLLGHLVSGSHFLACLTTEDLNTQQRGVSKRIVVEGGVVTVDGANLLTDFHLMFADNGVFFAVDRVLVGQPSNATTLSPFY